MAGQRARASRSRWPHYRAAEVREHDPDRYLATLFAPADAREALFALYAFDHEITRVRRMVSEPVAGLVRLQWWREALDALAADQPPSPGRRGGARAPGSFRAAAAAPRSGDPGARAGAEQRPARRSGGAGASARGELGGGHPCRHGSARRRRGAGACRSPPPRPALGLVRLLQGLPGDLRRGRVPLPITLLARHRDRSGARGPRGNAGAATSGRRSHGASARASASGAPAPARDPAPGAGCPAARAAPG